MMKCIAPGKLTLLARITMTMTIAVMMITITALASAQDTALKIQRSTAVLDIDSNVKHGQGFNGLTEGNPGDVWHYPNSLSCLVVFKDGKYALEKRDEQTLGKPKVKLAEGSFSADEMQQLRGILDAQAVQAIKSPRMPEWPDDAVAVHEIDTLSVRIDRAGAIPQEFMTVRERLKTTAMTGLDTFLDNGTQYQKTLDPLVKWFKDVEKKNKSSLKDAQPKYCVPINIE